MINTFEETSNFETFSNPSSYFQINSFRAYLNDHLATNKCLCLLFVTHVFGPILVSRIICFEKKGGDPHKRSIRNRLFSMTLINVMLFGIFSVVLEFVA